MRDAGASAIIGVTTDQYRFVEVCNQAGNVVSSGNWSSYRSVVVPTPAAGASEAYTVTVREASYAPVGASVTVEVRGSEAGAEDVVAQPTPGDVDSAFTHPGNGSGGGDDATAQPAPGDVDAGFTKPGVESGADFAAPTADWAYIRLVGGKQTVIAALQTRAAATVVVTESNGTVHRFTADDKGRVDVSMPWQGASSPAFTAVAHDGDDVSATATIMPTRG